MGKVRPRGGLAAVQLRQGPGTSVSVRAALGSGGRAQRRLHAALFAAVTSEVTGLSVCQNWRWTQATGVVPMALIPSIGLQN